MRSILTLSLPEELAASIKRKARRAGLSISEYVRRIFRSQEHLISEDELLDRCREAERDYKAGRTKILKTQKDIDIFFKDLGV